MNQFILGNRIPYEYFITSGKGEAEVGSVGLPFETGSYDSALNNAGIEDTNVIEYTSVIPTGAKQITKEEGLKRLQWGEVLECIKAESNGQKGSTLSAGVMTTSVTDPNGKYLGGFAVEYSGSGSKSQAEKSLQSSIVGMIERRGYGTMKGENILYKDNKTNKGYIIHPGKLFVYDTMDVKQAHGSVFVAICFVSYRYPHLGNNHIHNGKHKTLKNKTLKKSKK
jgi:arginine decarboxylase